ncbi:glycine betaine ABC transporter substrate-binding protein [Alkalihalobacillus pseudalcaliphilus]|uniref:ABC transporter substrate-binding protein n=1 Tax=Alkalihalobacillus pseudalcaliphilus TaxID=79884 RepID=UPI00064DA174|nr:glycine betaine ABC transporter substrate-binding protein [Alkalihalobacillus pseudalcaliphilus]KMK75195.1 glycine/betaine ABC transporter substrate-binding protein [Alkalihalobacillus pseudalcaliphilus]
MKKLGLVLILFIFILTACGSDEDVIKIGSKNFTESLILGEMYALKLEEAGYEVERNLNLGGTMIAHESLRSGEIDMYPEYTGTGLINILEMEPDSDQQAVYEAVASAYEEEFDLFWLEPTNANNSQGLVTTAEIAEQYDLYTISRLQEVASELRLASVPEFEEREDGLIGLEQAYGEMNFASIDLYDYGIKYQVILNGEADVTVGFTTDGDLTSDELVLLEDDGQFWPPYYVAPVVYGETLKKQPEIEALFNEVSALLDNEVLQQLNAEVDIEGREYAEVAKEFLEKNGSSFE